MELKESQGMTKVCMDTYSGNHECLFKILGNL